jgi:hypothetical protein
MNRRIIRRRLSRLERLLPDPPVEPLPDDVAAAAIDAGLAIAARTGTMGGDEFPGSVVNRGMVCVVEERLAALERGDTTPWIKLNASEDPRATAELDRILDAVGYDPASEPKQRVAPFARRRDPTTY